MRFIAPAMSFIAAGLRSVLVVSGARRLCESSRMLMELGFFIGFVVLDRELGKRSPVFAELFLLKYERERWAKIEIDPTVVEQWIASNASFPTMHLPLVAFPELVT